MKKKNLDLKKKLVLSKETIANLTPGQQAKMAGGYNQFSNTYCTINCGPPNTESPSHYPCVNTQANCGGPDSAHCASQDICGASDNCQTP